MIMLKKAQTGSGAATLVAVITLLIVLYILFLPADIREDILENTTSDNGNGDAESISGTKLLLSETPGVLEDLNVLEYEHSLPSINLFTTTGAEVIKKVNSLYVKRGVFDQKSEEIQFEIPDLERMDNFLLSFTAKKFSGRLIVKLNGKEIINTEMEKQSVDPVELEKTDLDSGNTLEFSVSDVGWMFWKTNEYILENIMVTSDVTDVSEQESKNVFMISSTEKHNLESGKLKFFPDCVVGQVGKLDVAINGREVFSAVPDCGALRPVEFDPVILKSGENNVVFKTRKGRYLIDHISVDTELKQVNYPTYFFDIEDDEYTDILDNKIDVNMTLRFVDDLEMKQAQIHINGKTVSMSTRDSEWFREITGYVYDGSNGIKIEPDDSTLEVIELRVVLVEVED
ncbi:hypothetical protein HQ529_03025 [Candidatus Woesearchaeota archaeon]|nr:hypothetical protein [Candidatus Woesearchaeota archaeon]